MASHSNALVWRARPSHVRPARLQMHMKGPAVELYLVPFLYGYSSSPWRPPPLPGKGRPFLPCQLSWTSELWNTQTVPHRSTCVTDICSRAHLNLRNASRAPCLWSSNLGGGGSFPSSPPLPPLALPSFFFFLPGIMSRSVSRLWRLLSYSTMYHTQIGGAIFLRTNYACAISLSKSQG